MDELFYELHNAPVVELLNQFFVLLAFAMGMVVLMAMVSFAVRQTFL